MFVLRNGLRFLFRSLVTAQTESEEKAILVIESGLFLILGRSSKDCPQAPCDLLKNGLKIKFPQKSSDDDPDCVMFEGVTLFANKI